MSRQQAREIAIKCKTLICFLESLVGQEIVIELKDDTRVTGTLILVDAFMNCTLTEVKVEKEKKILSGDFKVIGKYETFLVKGTRIRFVQYPDQVGDEIEGIEKVLKSYHSDQQNRILSSRRQPRVSRDDRKQGQREQQQQQLLHDTQ